MSTYILWWWDDSPSQYLFGDDELHACAKKYQFSADDVLRFGEVKFDDDDGNGAYGGCYREEESE
jgi:hypothetical protein